MVQPLYVSKPDLAVPYCFHKETTLFPQAIQTSLQVIIDRVSTAAAASSSSNGLSNLALWYSRRSDRGGSLAKLFIVSIFTLRAWQPKTYCLVEIYANLLQDLFHDFIALLFYANIHGIVDSVIHHLLPLLHDVVFALKLHGDAL